jgi:redox-sensitive bicupin YhaK (pirin superfamily)
LHSENNGVYIFVIEGEVETADEKLTRRDAIGIWDTENVQLNVKENSDVLIAEVPMALS